jgi:hypothetical protein
MVQHTHIILRVEAQFKKANLKTWMHFKGERISDWCE